MKSKFLVPFACLGWLAMLSVLPLAHAQPLAPVPETEVPGRRVFVPLEELQTLIQRDRNWVLLSREDFQKLTAEAKQNTLNKPQPPQALGVRDVKYTARIDEDQLVISATLKITKFSTGWQTLPLDFRDLAVEKALLGDKPAKLGRDPQAGGQLVLLLDQPGTQTLTLELSRPLAAVGGDKLAAFGLAPSWPAEFVLQVPPQKHLQWNGVAVERPAANDQPATFNLAFGGQKQVELRITDRPTEQSTEGLVFAHTTLGVRASPEEVTWQAVTSLQVFGKPLDRLQFKVPVGLQIISITSPGLESWDFGPKVPDATETILDLVYRQPFQEPREVTLKGVLATKADESWQVPNLKLANVASHVSQVLVTTAPGIRLQLDETVGVQRSVADAASVGESNEPKPRTDASSVGNEGMRFTAWREDFVLRFTTQPKAREMSAAVVTLLDITANGLDLQSRATIEARYAPLFDVSLTLPAEWTVNDVLVNQQHVAWETVPQEAGIHLLRVAFETPLPADQPAIIQLSAHLDPKDWPLEDGSTTFPLPEVRVLQSNAVEGTVVVAAERDLDVQPQELKGLAPTLLDPALSARLSYEYQDTHYSGKILVARKPSRISARTLAFHRLDKETFLSHLEARLTIAGGGTRKLQVSLPESAGTNLRFELTESPARIVEQTTAVPADGRRLWTLALDQRAYGDVLLLVDIAQPRNAAKEFIPPAMQLIGAERETGQLGFEAEPDQQLDIVATDSTDATAITLPDVDPTDLTAPTGYVPKERIVAAYSYVLPGYQTKLTERRFDRVAVPTAICDRLDLVSILGETGELQHEATFQIRAVGVQSLQVTLPEKAQLWATLLDEAPIEVRQTKTAYLIPFKISSSTDPAAVEDPTRVRTLKLYYRTQVGRLTAAGRLHQTPPGITVLNGDGTQQPLEILQQIWTVHHPQQTEFVEDPGSFIANQHQWRSSVLGDLLRSFQVDSPRNLFWKGVSLAAIAGIIWILGLLWRNAGAKGLIGLGAVVLIGGFFYSFASQETAVYKSAAEDLAHFRHDVGAPQTEAKSEVAAIDGRTQQPNSQFGDFLPPSGGNRAYTNARRSRNLPPPPARPASPVMTAAPEAKMEEEAPAEEKPAEPKPEEKPADVPTPEPPKPDAAKEDVEQKAEPIPAIKRSFSDTDGEKVRQSISGARDAAMAQARQPGIAGQAGEGGKKPNDELAVQGANDAGIALGVQPPLPGSASISSKAVLSLALKLEPPADSRYTTYTYRGRVQKSPPELIIGYQNRARLSFVMLVVEMSVTLLCWFVRRWSIAGRGLILALGIGGPLALMTVVPPATLPLLDVVLSGTLLGALLWLIVAFCQWFSLPRLWSRLNQPLVTSAAILLAFCLTLSGKTVYAAEKPAVAPPVKPAPTTPLIDAETLVVPFDGDTDPLKSNKVFLPYAKFVELWRQAHPEDPIVKDSPVAASIAEALYAAELVPAAAGKKAAIKVTGRFVCYSFRDTQVTLPLPLGKVAVSSAQLDGATAPLVAGTEQNPLAILISQPGLHVVDLQFTVPVQMIGPAGVFSLPLTDVPSGLLRFKVPGGDFNFRVNGSSGAFRKISKDAEAAELLIPVAAGGAFQVSWQPRQNRADVAGVIHVDSTSALLLTEEGPRLLSHWIFQVRQGSLAEVAFSLPAGLGIRKIEGQDVSGWEVGGEGDARQLKIFLRRKVEDTTQLKFDLFLKQPADDLETTYAIPQFAPLNITRETGTLAVLAEKQFSVRVGDISGLAQIEPQQVPLQRLELQTTISPTLAYRFANRPYELQLVVGRRQPQLKVTSRHLGHVDARKVQQQNRFQFRLTGAPRAGVAIVLPQGYLLQDVQAPEIADWHISGREDSADMDAEALLHLEFAAPRTGSFDVILTGKTLRQPDQLKAEVSLPYPLETDELETQLLTTLDPIYTGSATMLENWKSIDPAELAQLFALQGTVPNQLGFSSQSPAPAPVTFDLHQAQPRLSGQVLTLLTVEEDSLDYLFALRWNISTAGADTFVFSTPESLAGKLDFPEGNGPRRRSVTQEPTGNGRTRWTITLEDPQREDYFIVARAVLPPSAKGEVLSPGFVLEQITPGQDPPLVTPLETQAQYVVLVNHSQTQLTSTALEAVETTPAEDLTRVIKIRQDLIDQAAEIVRVRTVGADVAWKQQRFQAEQLLPAAVNLAHHITVLAPDGSWREQVTYRMRNRKRQFLAVKLPADSKVLSLFVKGQPARPVQPGNALGFTLIPLPKTVEGDLSFDVVMVLAGELSSGPLPRNWGLARQKIEVPIPAVVSPEENKEYGIAVSQTTWTVYAPEDLDIDVLRRPGQTNVNEVTETLQLYDQSVAVLNDVSELIAINSQTYSRRVQAQSYNNVKQLGVQLNELKSFANTQGATNSAEASKQRELQDRIGQLEKSIEKLEIRNNAQGLTIQQDAAGNTIVLDQKTGQNDQNARVSEFYRDNWFSKSSDLKGGIDLKGGTDTVYELSKDSAPKGKAKGNVDRGNLRGLNQKQVQELAVEQQKKADEQGRINTRTEQELADLLEQFNGLRNQRRYAEAEEVAKKARQLAPDSSSAEIMKWKAKFARRNTDSPESRKSKEDAVWGALDSVEWSAIPFDDRKPIVFGKNWNERGAGAVNGAFIGRPGPMVDGPAPGDVSMIYVPPAWTSAGGLSLLINIPTDGKVYSFSKLSGDAHLTLGVRPHETWQFALGLVWTATWVIILLVIGWTLSRPRAVSALLREAPWFLAALGTVSFFLIRSESGAGMFLSLMLFVVGVAWLACRKPARITQ